MDRELFERYHRTRSDEERNAILEYHWPWIKERVASILHRRGRDRLMDDILSHVAERVLERTIPGFDPDLGNFRQHLEHAIRRAILDALRPTSQNQKAMGVCRAREQLSHTLGRRATDAEVAEHMQIDESAVIAAEREDEVPLDCVLSSVDHSAFESLLEGLKPRHRQVIRMYYLEGLTEAEIAREFRVSRVAIHKQLKNAKNSFRRGYKTEVQTTSK